LKQVGVVVMVLVRVTVHPVMSEAVMLALCSVSETCCWWQWQCCCWCWNTYGMSL